MGFVALVVALGMVASAAGWTDLLGGVALLLLMAALAAVFRYRAALWSRQRREIRNEERVAMARELHDIVAHHVSAIAVQAQAGGVVAAHQPEKAGEVLAAIEAEASRTLVEMRSMVRVLREDESVAFAPSMGVADLPALARSDGALTVDVAVDSASLRLAGPVDAALYRIAQESLTRAARHAWGASRVIPSRLDGRIPRKAAREEAKRFMSHIEPEEPAPAPAPLSASPRPATTDTYRRFNRLISPHQGSC